MPQAMARPQPYEYSASAARHYSIIHVVDALQATARPLPTILALAAQRDDETVVPLVVRVLHDMAHPPPSCRALVAQHILPLCCLYAVSAAIMTYAEGAAI